jgi:catechol 2,3-dioxygenase-like lactoylglutathione lyase family enzyme
MIEIMDTIGFYMRISEIQLLSDDLTATVKYYTDVLGLRKIYQDNEKVSFDAGTSILTFIKSENVSPVYHFAFNIPPYQLMEAFQWMKQRTVLLPISDGVEIADFVNWNAKAFYFKDNNGNILEFIARYDLDIKAEKPFDSTSIVSICEIGIVSDDVTATANDISKNYQVPLFPKQPLLVNFGAMGDHEGLFILSKTGRHWHPNEVEARPYWSRTYFECSSSLHEIITR